MSANYLECEKANINPKDVERIAKGIERYAKQADKLGITIFGGSGSGSLRIHDKKESASRALILGDINTGYWDGGDGACWEDEEGLMRGE